jgi:hypothetical protein
MKRGTKWIIRGTAAVLLLTGAITGIIKYNELMSPPESRLAPGAFYKEMPPDSHHIYISLPVDHNNPALGTFTGFYLLSPGFKPGNDVIFQLYDNQQEMVGMISDSGSFDVFNERVGKDMSYVLIGNRGVSPTLFPEVFKADGKPDYALALKLYGSENQVEDIEAVRKDMIRRGLLQEGSRIMLYGGSGGGVLIQQYLNKYGMHVSRVQLESTAGPDLCRKNNLPFTRNLYEINPAAAEIYYKKYKGQTNNGTIAWMLFKIGLKGKSELQTEILNGCNALFDLRGKMKYLVNWLNPSQNYSLISVIFRAPQELEVKVRIWEIAGEDILRYNPRSSKDINLMLESLSPFLADFLNAYHRGEITPFTFSLDRSGFDGEVMIWANTGDQDFGPERAEMLAAAYPHARVAVFRDSSHHILKKDDFQLAFTKSFYETGLYSASTERYFSELKNRNN